MRTRRDLGLVVGVVIVGAVAALAILAPLIAPHDPDYQFRGQGLTASGAPVGPNAMFPLGTDAGGRDELSRLEFGARTSLIVGTGAALAATLIGTIVGLLAALSADRASAIKLGRRRLTITVAYESILMRLTDAGLSFPVILFAILLGATLGASLPLTVVLIASVAWARTARVIYASSLPVVASDYISAARATGVGERRILLRHVLPHVLPLAAVLGSLTVAGAILIEASLSYLGVSGATSSWGTMLHENLSYMDSQPRLLLLPGIAISITVLGFTLIADGLGDGLHSRRRRRSLAADDRHAQSVGDAT